MRQKTWPTLPQKMQVDSGIYQADRPRPSAMYGQPGGRLLFLFLPSALFTLPIVKGL